MQRATRLRWRTWVAAIWMTYGVLSAVQVYVMLRLQGQAPVVWYGPLAISLVKAGAWALATPLIVAWAMRFPFGAGARIRPAVIHGSTALVVLAIDNQVDALILRLLRGEHRPGVLLAYLDRADIVLLYYFVVILAVHLARYYESARRAQLEAAELKTALMESQLHLLKNQIRPHFLFNALNVISELTREDPLRAGIMIEKLGAMLRLSLEHGSKQLVPLASEVELVHLYLDLQKTRFEEWLEYEIDIDPQLDSLLIPAFLLQPLVENAIQHGVLPARRRCLLRVSAERIGERMQLSVTDDGAGLVSTDSLRKRVGLSNTETRLHRLYQGDFELTLRPNHPRGTRVVVTVPLTDDHADPPGLEEALTTSLSARLGQRSTAAATSAAVVRDHVDGNGPG